MIRIWECEIKTKVKREEAPLDLYVRITEPSNIEYYQSDEIDNELIAAESPIPYGRIKNSLLAKED